MPDITDKGIYQSDLYHYLNDVATLANELRTDHATYKTAVDAVQTQFNTLRGYVSDVMSTVNGNRSFVVSMLTELNALRNYVSTIMTDHNILQSMTGSALTELGANRDTWSDLVTAFAASYTSVLTSMGLSVRAAALGAMSANSLIVTTAASLTSAMGASLIATTATSLATTQAAPATITAAAVHLTSI